MYQEYNTSERQGKIKLGSKTYIETTLLGEWSHNKQGD